LKLSRKDIADEINALLAAAPETVARRDRTIAERKAKYGDEQRSILKDIKSAGYPVNSVWDLVNRKTITMAPSQSCWNIYQSPTPTEQEKGSLDLLSVRELDMLGQFWLQCTASYREMIKQQVIRWTALRSRSPLPQQMRRWTGLLS
jgi:hypothetical protein